MPTPGFLKGLERGYYDIKYAADNGLTLERHVVEQWQFLAGRARRALHGVDFEGKSPDEVAGAYHDKQSRPTRLPSVSCSSGSAPWRTAISSRPHGPPARPRDAAPASSS